MWDPESGELVADLLNSKWEERFMYARCTVSPVQTASLMPSAANHKLVESDAGYHFGFLMSELKVKTLGEDCVFKADETHLLADFHDGRTLALRGDLRAKYSDVFRGDRSMNLTVMVRGHSRPRAEVSLIVLQNDRGSYPILGVSIKVTGVCYRSEAKSSMGTSASKE